MTIILICQLISIYSLSSLRYAVHEDDGDGLRLILLGIFPYLRRLGGGDDGLLRSRSRRRRCCCCRRALALFYLEVNSGRLWRRRWWVLTT